MKYIVPAGRVLFSLIFIMAGLGHFSPDHIAYAAAKGVPMANVMVPLSGIISILGGLSIALGFKAKWGAFLIIIFLIPVTFMMHNFWTVADPMARQMQMANFMKNVSILGGALLIAYYGSGPVSLDRHHHSPSS